MTFADLIRKYGESDQSIAAGLGTTRQLVRHWRLHGISPSRQAWIQLQTRGRLKADSAKQQDGVQAA